MPRQFAAARPALPTKTYRVRQCSQHNPWRYLHMGCPDGQSGFSSCVRCAESGLLCQRHCLSTSLKTMSSATGFEWARMRNVIGRSGRAVPPPPSRTFSPQLDIPSVTSSRPVFNRPASLRAPAGRPRGTPAADCPFHSVIPSGVGSGRVGCPVGAGCWTRRNRGISRSRSEPFPNDILLESARNDDELECGSQTQVRRSSA